MNYLRSCTTWKVIWGICFVCNTLSCFIFFFPPISRTYVVIRKLERSNIFQNNCALKSDFSRVSKKQILWPIPRNPWNRSFIVLPFQHVQCKNWCFFKVLDFFFKLNVHHMSLSIKNRWIENTDNVKDQPNVTRYKKIMRLQALVMWQEIWTKCRHVSLHLDITPLAVN